MHRPADISNDALILCANNRLSRSLRLGFAQQQADQGLTVFPTLNTFTVSAWLSALGEEITLTGRVQETAVPARVLSTFQERLVWKQVIRQQGRDDPTLALFNLDGLAETAAEAHALLSEWQLPLAENDGAEETRLFLNWRAAFVDLCAQRGWLDGVAYQQRVLGWLEAGHVELPRQVTLAGFDRLSPLMKRLVDVLRRHGVSVSNHNFPETTPAAPQNLACADAEAECRAAADWASRQLNARPAARLGIVVANLDELRPVLLPILDEHLSPADLMKGDDSPSALYNVSLGVPLAREGLVRTALALLRLLARPQGLPLVEWGALLRMPYWSADQREADLRAQLDVRLRERAMPRMSLAQLERWVATHAAGQHSRLRTDLTALLKWQTETGKTRPPSDWAQQFQILLDKAHWPGERSLSSAEFQARAAFVEMLDTFGALDDFLGLVSMGTALSELTRLCRDKVFQPKTPGQPPIQVLGLIEAKGAQFDALWVMGMNDHLWPPPARPNPLLPASLQRQAGTPGASAEVQLAFAQDIYSHLLQAAPEIVFSYAGKAGERRLRASPLIATLPEMPQPELTPSALLSHLTPGGEGLDREKMEDHIAPPLVEGDTVSGGSGLLKAQAICPAWGFYRYRLGAKPLETPVEGFDERQRGTLVHAMLEYFWKAVKGTACFDELQENGGLDEKLNAAVEVALQEFETKAGEALSPTVRWLEAARLHRTGMLWLMLDGHSERPAFEVIECEKREEGVALGQLRINLQVDRIDKLVEDGRLIVIDYKTGNKLDMKSWQGDGRLTEPQLPLYAAIVLDKEGAAPVAAVVFAMVRTKIKERVFKGVAAEGDLIPGIKGLRPPPAPPEAEVIEEPLEEVAVLELVDPWQALLDSWRTRLEALAEEIRRGEAGVWFEDERHLNYCEVLPLLRLPERRAQFERMQGGAA